MAGSYNRAVFHENRHFLDTDCNIVELFLSIFYIYKQKNHFMITSNCEVRRNYTTKIKPARNYENPLTDVICPAARQPFSQERIP